MADRDALADLVDRVVRLLDPAGVLDLDRDTIAEHLDAWRTWSTAHRLEALADPTGAVLRHVGPEGWDRDAKVYDGTTLVTPTEADEAAGVWTFATDTPGPLDVSGWLYDLHAGAADAAETFAGIYGSRTQETGPVVAISTAGGESVQRAAPYALQFTAAAQHFRDLAVSLRRRSRAAMPGSVPVNVPAQAPRGWPTDVTLP